MDLGAATLALSSESQVSKEQHNERLDSLRLALEVSRDSGGPCPSDLGCSLPFRLRFLVSGAAEGCRAGGPARGLCRGTVHVLVHGLRCCCQIHNML